jgi:hypothetical protein
MKSIAAFHWLGTEAPERESHYCAEAPALRSNLDDTRKRDPHKLCEMLRLVPRYLVQYVLEYYFVRNTALPL